MHPFAVRDVLLSIRTIAAFAAIYVLWGSTYLGVAIGVESIPPFLLMATRCLAAGAILLAIERLRAPIRLPTGTWKNAAMGVFCCSPAATARSRTRSSMCRRAWQRWCWRLSRSGSLC